MNRIALKPIYLVAFVIAGFAISRSAQADVQAHLVAQAAKIDRQATQLLTETRHYRLTPNYGRMVAEVAILRAKARHMRYATFNRYNFHVLEDDLRMVERCFHKVEAFFDTAEISAARGVGQIQGSTRHVKKLLNCMKRTICEMRDDVRELKRCICGSGSRTIIQSTVYEPPTIYRGSRTIYNSGRPAIQFSEWDDCELDRLYRNQSIRNQSSRNQNIHRGHDRHGVSRSAGGLQINGRNMSFRIRF